jgi:hypothetical protein
MRKHGPEIVGGTILGFFLLITFMTGLAICASIIALAGDLIGLWEVVDWI